MKIPKIRYRIFLTPDADNERFEELDGATFDTVKEAAKALRVAWDHVIWNTGSEWSACDQKGNERALICGYQV